MPKSDVGVVIQYPQPSVFQEIEQWRPKSAVLIDLNQDLAKHLRANGCEFLVARLQTEPPLGDTVTQAFELGAQYTTDYVAVDTVRNGLFDAIQSPVGYVDNNSDSHRHNLFAAFQLGMLKGIVEFNSGYHPLSVPWGVPPERSLRLCAMNMFTGHGSSEMLTEYYSDVLNHPSCLLLGTQEYSWPSLYQGNNVFRWKEMVEGFPDIQVYVAELGLTQLVWVGVEGATPGDDGWLFPENNTPFQDVSTPLDERFVLGSMEWYNSVAKAHPQYLGCAWYLIGPGVEQWVSHDVGSLAGKEFKDEPAPEPEDYPYTVVNDSEQGQDAWFKTEDLAQAHADDLGPNHVVVKKV